MKLSLRRISLRKLITIALFVLLVAIVAIFTVSSLVSLRFVQTRIYENTEDTVAVYQKQADEDLGRVDRYLYTVMSSNSSFIRLSYVKETERDYYRQVSVLGTEFSNAVFSYKAEAFYDYIPDSDTFILGASGNTTFSQYKEAVLNEIAQKDNNADWRAVKVNDDWYLMRILQSGKQYLGSFVKISDLIADNPDKEADKDRNYYCLVDASLQVLHAGTKELFLAKEGFSEPYSVEEIEGNRCLVVHKKLEKGDFYLTSITPYSSISQVTGALKTSLIVMVVFIFLIWMLLVVVVEKSILEPVTTITDALSEVAAGNLEQRIPVHSQSQEFQSIAKTYNIMVSEIKDLKIHVYEQQIVHAKLETQYLKQQITPHFMINCLNTACQLTECGELELARRLLRELSVHLRYVLSSGRTVRLSEELDLVQNYIELSSIRYPESLHYKMSCPEELKNCAVVPLMLLNHVENTIKHEVVVGERLDIFIDVSEEIKDGQKILCAIVRDTGKGFSEEALELFQEISGLPVEETPTQHLGISNVLQRTKKEFPGAEFTFSNHETGGAQVVIRIPEVIYAGQKQGETLERPADAERSNRSIRA